MNRLLVGMLLLAGSAQASSVASVVGWTHDGKFAYVINDGNEEGKQLVVLDVAGFSGTRTFPLTGGTSDAPAEEDKKTFEKLGSITPASAAGSSADGKAFADVLLSASGSKGSWNAGHWEAGGPDAWQFSVKKGGKTFLAASSGSASSVTVYFSPDGRRTVWIVHYAGRSMRDPSEDDVLVGTGGTVAVGIVIDRARLSEGKALAARLAKAGFEVMSVTAALKARDATVVYFSDRYPQEAKQLAALIPGATTEALTWASPRDLVVAVGKPAAGK